MEIGKVIGNVWATKKDEGISGQKLLVVNIMKNRQQKKDSLLVAADITGAGIGDLVLVCEDGGAAELVFELEDSVCVFDGLIVGVIDE